MNQCLIPGDVCIVIASSCLTEQGRSLIGAECTLMGYAPMGDLRHPQHATYLVAVQGGSETVLCARCLRRKPPREQQGSWARIERLTGWRPRGVETTG